MSRSPWKQLREKLGLTQTELGKSLGVSASRVCQLESGQGGTLRSDGLVALSTTYRKQIKSLGLSLDDFLRGGSA